MIKELKDIAWNVTEKEYRNDKAISYSTLSTFARTGVKGLKEIMEGVEYSSPALRHGSLVDTLLTDQENFDNLYIISDYNPPTEVIKKIVDDIWEDQKHEKFLDLFDYCEHFSEIALNIINNNGYGADNWKPETKIKKIVEGGSEYYSLLHLLEGGKELISQTEYDTALACVNEVRENPYTKNYLTNTKTSKTYFQLKFKINFNKNELFKDNRFNRYENIYEWKESFIEEDTIRCMFDIIHVDYANKIIYPIDLKTTAYMEEDFEKSIRDWRYDLQATKYHYILREVCAADEYFKDFKIEYFAFLPINKTNLSPCLYVYPLSLLDEQPEFKNSNNILHRPWYDLLEDVRWHIENNEYRYSRKTVNNHGINEVKEL